MRKQETVKNEKHNKSQHMLKILSQQQQQEETSRTKRTLDIKTNFGPLKQETEQVYNQNIYYFLFLQV